MVADITLLVLLGLETNYILLPQIIVLIWKEVLWYPKKIVFNDGMKILLVQDRESNGKLKSERLRWTPCVRIEPANCETNKVCSVVFATVGWKVQLPSEVDCGAIIGCLCDVRKRLPPMRVCDGQELMHGAGVKHCLPLSDLAAGRRVIASFGHPTSDVSLTSDSPPPY